MVGDEGDTEREREIPEEPGKERSWWCERGETEDERDLNGKREGLVGRWGREGARERWRKKEIDTEGNPRVRQAPRVTRHSAS